MSKCDVAIELENKDRIFYSGDVIRGEVIVNVNKDVDCRGIKLRGTWETHGVGNRDRSHYFSTNLYQGDLEAGRQYSFPFELKAPYSPLSYHGSRLNIDHYFDARVDIPWAFDPKTKIDYLLLPGESHPVEAGIPIAREKSTTHRPLIAVVAAIFFIVGFMLIPAFGFGLIFVAIAAVIGFYTFRSFLAEKLIGKVEVDIGPPIKSGGQSFPMRVDFRPLSGGQINDIRVTLLGQEICISGSGSNRKTHTKVLHKEKVSLCGPNHFKRGDLVSHSVNLSLPATDAYSFEATNNRIVWSVDTHIDIRRWPDWLNHKPFTLIAGQHLTEPPVRRAPESQSLPVQQASPIVAETVSTAVPALILGAKDSSADDSPHQGEEAPDSRQPETKSDPSGDVPLTADEASTRESKPIESRTADSKADEPATITDSMTLASPESAVETGQVIDTAPELMGICDQLKAARRFSDEAKEIIAANDKAVYPIAMKIERTTSTIGCYDEPEYRSGRTIIGRILETEQSVAVQMPGSENDKIRDLRSGDEWRGKIRLKGWDDLYKRAELRFSR